MAEGTDTSEPVAWRELLQQAHQLLDRGDGLALVGPDGKVEYVSPSVEQVLGRKPADLVGRVGDWLTHESDVAAIRPLYRELMAEPGARRTFVSRVLHVDGRHRWIESTITNFLAEPRVRAMVVDFRDVTEKLEAREALAEERRRLVASEANFRALIEASPVGVAVHRERKIVYANPTLLRLLDTTLEQIMGADALSVVTSDRREQALERIRQIEREPGNPRIPRMETALSRRDGTEVAVEIEAVKLDFDGQPSVVVLITDIRDRQAMLARLAASDRLASLGTLVAGVAHEINNPLAFIQMNLTLLAEHLDDLAAGRAPKLDDAELTQVLVDAREGADRIRELVRDLRAFARPDPEPQSPVDVREVLESCIRMAHNELKARARVVAAFGELPAIAGSASRLGQVFLNLLINAAQAIPEDRSADNEVRVSAFRAASGEAVVEIADTGVGIAPEILGHVFDPFFTTKPLGVGTGLGLSICHGIVTGMGGQISVESEVGRGSTFRVVLPAFARPAAPSERPSKAPPPRAPRRATILVIDDERAMGDSLRLLLGIDHDVRVATCARAALDEIASGRTYDLILCDLMMPDMTGMAFYDALAARAPALAQRVVFLTGGAFSPSSRAFLERVPNRWLEKPFDFDALREALDAVAASGERET
jgi:PAS domain S-box-containing protein